MKKTTLAENLVQYQFPPNTGTHFGFNIFALVAGRDEAPRKRDALLIDAGFEKHAATVREDLACDGCRPRQIIISHFHHDHIAGLKALPELTVLGSGRYQTTLNLCTPTEEHARYRPTRILTDASTTKFGDFSLRFRVMAGHALCNVYTIIDDRFIHIGDDIMASNGGASLLPSVECARLADHIASLEMLKDFNTYTFLLGHGPPLSGPPLILEAIENRLRYLRAVLESSERISYEDAVRHCTCAFLHSEWHEYLYE
jgi:glyoxylase-like metal-dependent hydrolase (beta-lactamase superfamily II)